MLKLPFHRNADDEIGGDAEDDTVEGIDDLREEEGIEGAVVREGPRENWMIIFRT